MMKSTHLREFILSNGVILPSVGLGTYRIKDPDVLSKAISSAISSGYRLIDTASVYRNMPIIGELLENRSEIFITSKLGPKEMGAEKAGNAIRSMLKELRRPYLDCLLIHWPGVQGLEPSSPQNATLRLETWRLLEEFYSQGTLKSIGVSNFNISHLEPLLRESKIVPHINQIECHPQYRQDELVSFCKSKGIHVQAYSSLGTTKPSQDPLEKGITPLLQDPYVLRLASAYEKSPAQILLRWALQNGCSVLPKSVHSERIEENIQLFNFEIRSEDLKGLNSISIQHKYAWNPDSVL